MLNVKFESGHPVVTLHVPTERKLRECMGIVQQLERFPEQYPDAPQLRVLLAKLVAPEPEPKG
jgi:hypothetical protein